MQDLLNASWRESLLIQEKFFTKNMDRIVATAETLVARLRRWNKILICGNGGSAAQAQHFAAELVGRYEIIGRPALPAIALTTDTSSLTAIGNDVGFDAVFSRQVEALGREGDVLMGISTSGTSSNVLSACRMAKHQRMVTVGLAGRNGGPLARMVDFDLTVEHPSTARVQEVHQILLHLFCQVVDSAMMK